MRRLLILASAIIFLDVAFYAAITPLLPSYSEDLDLGKAGAGILTASYAAGTLLAAIPAGFVAARVGPRRTVISGLLLLGTSSAVFGFAEHIVLLDSARFVQGISGALTWSGAFTWLIIAAPDERRGTVIGGAIGTAVGGALFGPPLGALATEVGTEPVFSSVLVFTLVLAAAAFRLPDTTRREENSPREVLGTLRSGPVLGAAALVGVPSLMFGATSVLVPLRVDELGGSAALIAAGFTVGAALEAMLAPAVGRYSDRAGRLAPFVVGVTICALMISLVGFGDAIPVVLGAEVGIAVGAGFCFVPATTILSEAAEAHGLHQGFAAGLMNLAWAGGQVSGAIAGGAVAGLAGYAAPCLGIAALLLATALLARRLVGGAPVREAGLAERV